MLVCDLALKMESDAMDPRICVGATLYCERIEKDAEALEQASDSIFVVLMKDNNVTVCDLNLCGLCYKNDPYVHISHSNYVHKPSVPVKLSEIEALWRVVFVAPPSSSPAIWKVK